MCRTLPPVLAAVLLGELVLAATVRAQLGPGTTRSDDTARAPSPPLSEAAAQAEPEVVPYRAPKISWNPAWTRFDLGNYLIFGTGVTLAVGGYLLGPRADKSRGGVLLDDDARSSLRLRTLGAERFARDTSDVLLSTLVSYPFFDSLVVTGWYRQSSDVAEQTALINAEAMAFTAGLHAIANVAFSRERPYGRLCGSEKPEDGRDCDSSRNRYFSFFSGHSSQAFTSAGLICIHHHYLGLYGGGGADGLVCAAGLILAATTATLRVAGDQHYLSDVVVGAAVGTLSGLGLPWLLHYRGGAPVSPDSGGSALRVRVMPTPNGAAIVGSFP